MERVIKIPAALRPEKICFNKIPKNLKLQIIYRGA